ncbi:MULTISPECIES: hypothetical protein [Bradyrhizobium]|uniref:Uncharacterized protein n=1 Tax=Bradyrhizobium zhanjiangense TaxID=1325107 RepID=A0A4Q0S7X8_9BRAD|nr:MULTISPECIES: hypothetical protein [Bradyrhizobium]RXG88825.1 hypothetical protein EAS62_32145 [Bradyrhizobium zhanjiangense]RXH00108.1 hypothetical protein EAS61_10610 [Bradyrhizobium zhanjiangense]RXH33097.1 hypothetical protein XH94_30990 [Bradyrhizobium zhanjiangense]UQR62936.1 hypothetical protein LRP30_40410 [Bradyrhizobium sp. C-145]
MADRIKKETRAGAIDNVIALPLSPTSLVANTRRDCKSLQQSIVTMQQCLRALGDFVRNLDDGPEAERLRAHMAELNELLSLRLDQLSLTERLLQEMLRRG